jgi:hypothetical protein
MSQAEQVVLAPAADRGAQDLGQRQAVLGRGEKPQERQEVLRGQRRGQIAAVDAGDGQALRLQRRDDLLEERRAPAHEDQDVARFDRARALVVSITGRSWLSIAWIRLASACASTAKW